METEIFRIIPYEDDPSVKLKVVVYVGEAYEDGHTRSAEITVFLEKKDYALSELRSAAIAEARAFLKRASEPEI